MHVQAPLPKHLQVLHRPQPHLPFQHPASSACPGCGPDLLGLHCNTLSHAPFATHGLEHESKSSKQRKQSSFPINLLKVPGMCAAKQMKLSFFTEHARILLATSSTSRTGNDRFKTPPAAVELMQVPWAKVLYLLHLMLIHSHVPPLFCTWHIQQFPS